MDNSNGSNNIIGEGSVLKGNLNTSGNVRLEGKVIGDLSSSSKVACGETSVVDGNVIAENAEIAGKVTGKVTVVENEEADKYFSSRKYGSKISAWASSQSEQMKSRDEFLNKIKEYEKKYPKEKVVPRPPHWSGWRVLPNEIEFWLELDNRSHQRLVYKKENGKWIKEMLYP